tara:strand:+ start:140 stop:295 length:156 start_codon:yes stop_codon:yes gene_type:complete
MGKITNHSLQKKETLSRDSPESREEAIVTSSGNPIGKPSGDTKKEESFGQA